MLQNGHHGAGFLKQLYSPAQDFRLRHGDPNDLEDYKGGRDFDALKKFTELTGARDVGHGAWGRDGWDCDGGNLWARAHGFARGWV